MNKIFKAACVILFSGVFATGLMAENRPLVEGEDYEVMGPKGSKKAEVFEFFSYACGSCYTMETFINRFKKENSEIKIIPVPNDLGRTAWQIYIKAYYLGELLKVLDQSHSKIFHMINVEKKHITSDEALKAFFMTLGVDSSKYDRAYKSVALDMRVRKAKQLARKYRITGTPTFVANQRFKLNNSALGSKQMIEKALKELTIITL